VIIEKCIHGARIIGECKECKKIYAIKARLGNPSKFLWTAAKYRARKYDLPFQLSVEDVVIPGNCIVLGIPLDSRDRDHTPSIDEIIPGLGYVPGNFAVISGRANRKKSDSTLRDLQAIECYIRIRIHKSYGIWPT
jgi:hypothetical protein